MRKRYNQEHLKHVLSETGLSTSMDATVGRRASTEESSSKTGTRRRATMTDTSSPEKKKTLADSGHAAKSAKILGVSETKVRQERPKSSEMAPPAIEVQDEAPPDEEARLPATIAASPCPPRPLPPSPKEPSPQISPHLSRPPARPVPTPNKGSPSLRKSHSNVSDRSDDDASPRRRRSSREYPPLPSPNSSPRSAAK